MRKKYLSLIIILSSFVGLKAQVPSLEWADQVLGGVGYGYAVALDNFENVYVCGEFAGTSDFDPGPDSLFLTAQDTIQADIFVIKLSSDGNLIWVKQFSGKSNDHSHSLTVNNNRVIITGNFRDTVDFDPGTGDYKLISKGMDDIFITCLDLSGNFQWANSMGGIDRDEGHCVKADNYGNIYLTGFFRDTVDLNPDTTIVESYISKGNDDLFIQKYDQNGNLIRTLTTGSTGFDGGNAVYINQGTLYLTGYYAGTVDFDFGTDTFNLTGNGIAKEIFVMSIDTSGNFNWAKSMGNIYADEGTDIALDDSGFVYTVGCFLGSVDFDPNAGNFTLSSGFYLDIFIQKLDSQGNFVWVKQIGANGEEIAGKIVLDNEANIYLTGNFDAPLDFDPGPTSYIIPSSGSDDSFILKLDSSGIFKWVTTIGSNSVERGLGITLGANNTIYATGFFADTCDFDPAITSFPLIVPISTNIYIEKLKQCFPSFDSISISSCNSFLSPSNNYVWNTSGIYYDKLENSANCDSIITIYLTVNFIDTTVTQTGLTLISNTSTAIYQWLDCNNGYSVISGETNQTFTATQNGSYAVEVTENGCTDTSACYSVTGVGVNSVTQNNKILIFPNPVENFLNVQYPYLTDAIIEITDIQGKVLFSQSSKKSFSEEINIQQLSEGMYFLKINDNNKTNIFKIIKS